MKEDEILMCLIAFVLGYLVARMMRGNGLSVGVEYDNDNEVVVDMTKKMTNGNWFDSPKYKRNEYIDNYQGDSVCNPNSDEAFARPECEEELFNFCTELKDSVRVPTEDGEQKTFPCDVKTMGDVRLAEEEEEKKEKEDAYLEKCKKIAREKIKEEKCYRDFPNIEAVLDR